MSKIKILPEEVSNLIAAGEVVERPASAVKELVENAVDAGATFIKVEIKGAGRKLISVTDNGSGMDAEDALLCLQPHGTSKIASAGDIDAISTLGFRGEAIPSIAAVSRLRIRTRTAETAEGIEIITEGGKITAQYPCGMQRGTCMEIKDLFYNVPARKKFLRSAPTEEAHIQETVIAVALPNPQIGFELSFDSSVLFHSAAGNDPKLRLAEFFGKKQVAEYLEIKSRRLPGTNITFSGFIAPPGMTRGSRREQRFFVNGRAVESSILYRGLKDGYGERCESGRFPPAVLFLTMPPEEFDINVHPTKKEIRFREEHKIAPAISGAVSERLSEALRSIAASGSTEQNINFSPDEFIRTAEINYTPEAPQPELTLFGRKAADSAAEEKAISVFPEEQETEEFADTGDDAGAVYQSLPMDRDYFQVPASATPSPREEREENSSSNKELRFIGIFQDLYIIVSWDGELRIIDQHAAHERILFERFLSRSTSTPPAIQQLLIPEQLELDKKTLAFFTRHQKSLSDFGFDLSLLSRNTLMINGLPADLPSSADPGRCLTDIFDALMESGATNWIAIPRDELARAACHSAIRGNDKISEAEAVVLINDLQKCKRPDCCPHGRPTMITLTARELTRRFGRS